MRTAGAVAGLLLATFAAPVANAAPATPTCHLVRDPAGDVHPDVTAQVRLGSPSPALDIVGGDIAADSGALTVVIRVAGPIEADTYSPTGYSYSFQFTVDAGDKPQVFKLAADIGPTAQSYTLFRSDDNAGFSGLGKYARGSLDSSRRTIRMTADMTELQALATGTLQHPEGHRLRDFQIMSGTSTGEQNHAYVSSQGEDVADSNKATKIGTPSCVKPG